MDFEEDEKERQKRRINKAVDQMSAGKMEVFSVMMSRINYEEVNKYHSYWCFFLLIVISSANAFQRSAIQYMYSFQGDEEKMSDPHYQIRLGVPDFTQERFADMVGDSFTIIYAFMVLFTGSISDLVDRNLLLGVSCFIWCLCTYLSSFCTTFWQLNALRLVQSFFSAFSGPCSYSLITDWIPPH
mmetsp:Transcript_11201/g.18842  ORF Transcript_11201/g.18842 Transcript_11201/m.18842 type:complete len:185 (+) Transcript_11201:285-839(+)